MNLAAHVPLSPAPTGQKVVPSCAVALQSYDLKSEAMGEPAGCRLDDGRIRSALVDLLRRDPVGASGAAILEELGIMQGTVRADLAVCGDSLHGYEIKSDIDSLRRLQRQAAYYSRVFDFVTLVSGPRHADRAEALVPGWWGILLVDEAPGCDVSFTQRRAAARNPDVDVRALAEFVWLDEGISLLRSCGYRGATSRLRRRELWDMLVELVPPEELRRTVSDRITTRARTQAARLPA